MTADLHKKLADADRKRDVYKPNHIVAHQVAQVTEVLASLVAVTGAGKSFLIPHIMRLGGVDFSEAGNISSRKKRVDDPANFRGSQSKENLLERIRRQELVNYMIHPSGEIYASDAQSYTTRYVTLPTLTTALPQLQNSGCFNRIIPVGIVVDGETWDNERLGENRHSLARMQEALTCIAWLRAHIHQIPILENKTGKEEETAQKIIDITLDPSHPRPLDNLERIEFLLNELAAVASRHVRRLERI